jgi:hypothetical protein
MGTGWAGFARFPSRDHIFGAAIPLGRVCSAPRRMAADPMRSPKFLKDPSDNAGHCGNDSLRHPMCTRRVIPTSTAGFRNTIRKTDGAFSIGFAGLAFCCIAGAVGIMKVFQAVDLRDRTQILMDRCTGGAAVKMRTILENVEGSNQRMRGYHAASIASVVTPAILQAVRLALEAERAYQGVLRSKWSADAGIWLLGQATDCRKVTAIYRNASPPYPFQENPALPAGPAPSTYIGPEVFYLELRTPGLKSRARLKREQSWKVRWLQ